MASPSMNELQAQLESLQAQFASIATPSDIRHKRRRGQSTSIVPNHASEVECNAVYCDAQEQLTHNAPQVSTKTSRDYTSYRGRFVRKTGCSSSKFPVPWVVPSMIRAPSTRTFTERTPGGRKRRGRKQAKQNSKQWTNDFGGGTGQLLQDQSVDRAAWLYVEIHPPCRSPTSSPRDTARSEPLLSTSTIYAAQESLSRSRTCQLHQCSPEPATAQHAQIPQELALIDADTFSPSSPDPAMNPFDRECPKCESASSMGTSHHDETFSHPTDCQTEPCQLEEATDVQQIKQSVEFEVVHWHDMKARSVSTEPFAAAMVQPPRSRSLSAGHASHWSAHGAQGRVSISNGCAHAEVLSMAKGAADQKSQNGHSATMHSLASSSYSSGDPHTPPPLPLHSSGPEFDEGHQPTCIQAIRELERTTLGPDGNLGDVGNSDDAAVGCKEEGISALQDVEPRSPCSTDSTPTEHDAQYMAKLPSSAQRAAYRHQQREWFYQAAASGCAEIARAALAGMCPMELRGSHAEPLQQLPLPAHAAVVAIHARKPLSPMHENQGPASGQCAASAQNCVHFQRCSNEQGNTRLARLPRKQRRKQWAQVLEPDRSHVQGPQQPCQHLMHVVPSATQCTTIAQLQPSHPEQSAGGGRAGPPTRETPPWWHGDTARCEQPSGGHESASLASIRLPPMTHVPSLRPGPTAFASQVPEAPDLSPYTNVQRQPPGRSVALQALKASRTSERMSRLWSHASASHVSAYSHGPSTSGLLATSSSEPGTVLAHRVRVLSEQHLSTHCIDSAHGDDDLQEQNGSQRQAGTDAQTLLQKCNLNIADARLVHEQDARHDSEWQSRLDSVRSQLASGGMEHFIATGACGNSYPTHGGNGDISSWHSSQGQDTASSQSQRVKGPGDDFSGMSLEDVMVQGRRFAHRRRRSLGSNLARGSPGLLDWDFRNHPPNCEPDHNCMPCITSAHRVHDAESPFGGLSLAEVLHRPPHPDMQPQMQRWGGEEDKEPRNSASQLRADNVDSWGGSTLAEVLASGAAARQAAVLSQQDTMLPPPPGMEISHRSSAERGVRQRQQRNRPQALQVDARDSSVVHTPPVPGTVRALVSARRPRHAQMGYRQMVRQPQRPPMRADLLQGPTGRVLLWLLEQFTYSKAAYEKHAARHRGGCAEGDLHECSVCLEAFRQKQVLRRYLGCGHCYHEKCIDAWLARGDARCPLCRWDPVKEGW